MRRRSPRRSGAPALAGHPPGDSVGRAAAQATCRRRHHTQRELLRQYTAAARQCK